MWSPNNQHLGAHHARVAGPPGDHRHDHDLQQAPAQHSSNDSCPPSYKVVHMRETFPSPNGYPPRGSEE